MNNILTIERSVCKITWQLKFNGSVLEVCHTKLEAEQQKAFYVAKLGL